MLFVSAGEDKAMAYAGVPQDLSKQLPAGGWMAHTPSLLCFRLPLQLASSCFQFGSALLCARHSMHATPSYSQLHDSTHSPTHPHFSFHPLQGSG